MVHKPDPYESLSRSFIVHVVQELRQKGYKIIDAVNILKWKTKEPLPMFMLTFDRT
jgi:hypothetical protein